MSAAIGEAPVRAPAELEAYLAELERRARHNGVVTALEIEPGVAMALDHATPERAQAFSERMARLGKELSANANADGSPGGAAVPPVVIPPADLPSALGRIAGASGEEKAALVRGYLEAAQQLPEEQEVESIAALNRIAAGGRLPPSLTAVDDLWARTQAADDDSGRQARVREYLDLLTQLPEEEERRRLEEVNHHFGVLAKDDPAHLGEMPD